MPLATFWVCIQYTYIHKMIDSAFSHFHPKFVISLYCFQGSLQKVTSNTGMIRVISKLSLVQAVIHKDIYKKDKRTKFQITAGQHKLTWPASKSLKLSDACRTLFAHFTRWGDLKLFFKRLQLIAVYSHWFRKILVSHK